MNVTNCQAPKGEIVIEAQLGSVGFIDPNEYPNITFIVNDKVFNAADESLRRRLINADALPELGMGNLGGMGVEGSDRL